MRQSSQKRVLSEPDATEQANAVISDWRSDPQIGRAQCAAAALYGRYVEIRGRVRELKNSSLTSTELADITKELLELVDLNEKLREIGGRIRAADHAYQMHPTQSRTARMVLGWGVLALAQEAGVSPNTVARFERGEATDDAVVKALQHALEASGVEFASGDPGVSVRKEVSKPEPKIREI
jgi:transcriptional regulator with XRE-family HTH domain